MSEALSYTEKISNYRGHDLEETIYLQINFINFYVNQIIQAARFASLYQILMTASSEYLKKLTNGKLC